MATAGSATVQLWTMSPKSMMPTISGFGIWDSGFAIRNSGSGIWDSGFAIRNSGSGIWDSGFAIRNSGLGIRDQHIPIVGVVMNGGAAKRRPARLDGLQRGCAQALDELTLGAIEDERQMLADDTCRIREVPVKVAMDGGMIEVRERGVQTADRPAEAFEQRGRARASLSQRDAGEIRDEAHEMAAARRNANRVARDRR